MDLEKEIEQLIDRSLAEDIRSGDITSLACLSDCRYTTGMMFLKQSGIVAGLPLLALLFCKLNPQSEVTLMVPEGRFQKAGTQIA
nr:nicotinate-nucleotide diphosphorylase (carboxylating) [Parachlamydiaceae bacterium]